MRDEPATPTCIRKVVSWKQVTLCLAGIVSSVLWYGPALQSSTYLGVNDFLSFYTGGVLAGTGKLYNTSEFLATQEKTVGYSNSNLTYVRLPWQAVMLWPLGRLPYRFAYLIWQIGQVVAIVFAIRLWPSPDLGTRVAACLCSLPLFTAFALGQDIPLVLLATTATFVLWDSGRMFAAGLCLSLCSAKIHLLWPFAAVLLLRSERRFRYGSIMGGAGLALLCFCGGGRRWIPDFLHGVRLNEARANLEFMPNLHRFLAGTPWLEAMVTIAVLLAIGFAARASDWKLGAAAALAGGLLVGRHSFVADCSLLLPAVAILAERLPAKRAWLVLILSPVVYWPSSLGYPLPTVLAICGVLSLAVCSAVPGQLVAVEGRNGLN
jgi:hypothetical protein